MKRACTDGLCTQRHKNLKAEPNSKVAASSISPFKANYFQMKKNHLKLSAQLRTATVTTVFALLMLIATLPVMAQGEKPVHRGGSYEQYGNTLNLGLGIGYYGYLGQSVPFIFVNYEFQVARNFTIAPFIGYASYRSYDDYYFGGRYFYYHETVVPIGAKGTYYFDRLLGAGPVWDFYLAASVGFVYDRVVWDDGYYGDKNIAHSASPLYLDGHIGAEYHLGRWCGLFLDLSTGVSTVGLAIHSR